MSDPDLTIDGSPVTPGETYVFPVEAHPQDEQNGIWTLHKAELRQKRTPKGKLASMISAIQRLSGRTPTARELQRRAVKEFKRKQKRMELLTGCKYPHPKKQRETRGGGCSDG